MFTTWNGISTPHNPAFLGKLASVTILIISITEGSLSFSVPYTKNIMFSCSYSAVISLRLMVDLPARQRGPHMGGVSGEPIQTLGLATSLWPLPFPHRSHLLQAFCRSSCTMDTGLRRSGSNDVWKAFSPLSYTRELLHPIFTKAQASSSTCCLHILACILKEGIEQESGACAPRKQISAQRRPEGYLKGRLPTVVRGARYSFPFRSSLAFSLALSGVSMNVSSKLSDLPSEFGMSPSGTGTDTGSP